VKLPIRHKKLRIKNPTKNINKGIFRNSDPLWCRLVGDRIIQVKPVLSVRTNYGLAHSGLDVTMFIIKSLWSEPPGNYPWDPFLTPVGTPIRSGLRLRWRRRTYPEAIWLSILRSVIRTAFTRQITCPIYFDVNTTLYRSTGRDLHLQLRSGGALWGRKAPQLYRRDWTTCQEP